MKKIKELIKTHDNITILIILVVMITTFMFNIQLGANDELWCFSNIYKMTNGYEIYKDLNVIVTPLFFFIGQIIFEIFGANYFVYRIYAIGLIYLSLFFVIYQLFKKLKIEKLNSMLYTILIATVCLFILLDPSYNMLAIVIAIIGIIVTINSKCRIAENIVQGIIMFLVFMSKQNTGVLYITGIVIAQILINKNNKKKIKNIFIQLISSAILLVLFLSYLQINNNLYNFINYTVLGISEFANENANYNICNILIIAIEIIIQILFIVLSNKSKIPLEEIQRKNIKILATVGIFTNFIAYPMFNTAHTLIGSIIFLVFISYIFDLLMFRELLKGKKVDMIKKYIILIIFAMFLILNVINNSDYIKKITKKDYYFTKNNPYYGSIATEETLTEIEEICNYIKKQNEQGIEVRVISYYSNLYMNILNRNNKNMDLPFYGNMGKDGENGMINEIEKLKNTKILILTEDDNFYQESKEVTKFIKENLEKEGEISRFSIYITK